MREGRATTEHRRAWRAEAACVLLAGGGLWLAVWPLLLVAVALYAGVAIAYSHHRTALKRTAIEAEAMRPQQRVL